MTSSGGTGRPASRQDVRKKSASPPDTAESTQRSNGKPPSTQSPNGASGSQEGAQRNAPDPAVNTRRQQPAPDSDRNEPRGAAAARVATKITRTREDTTPGNEQDATPNPWAKPASPQEAMPVRDEQPASPQRSGPPVPPPSLVAKQRREAAAQSSVAPAIFPEADPLSAPASVNVPAAPAPQPIPADTEASLEAVPRTESPRTKPARPTVSRRSGRVRKARLRLLRVDPWSVMKTAFLLSVALGITLFVAVAVLWSVLDAAGVFESVDGIITDMTASDTNAGIDINQYIELSRVLGFTTLIAVVDVVLLTALATLGAFLYNLSASLLGGLELTLAEDD